MAFDPFKVGVSASVCPRTITEENPAGDPCYISGPGATCATIAPAIARTFGMEWTQPAAGPDGVVPEADRGCVRALGLVVPAPAVERGVL